MLNEKISRGAALLKVKAGTSKVVHGTEDSLEKAWKKYTEEEEEETPAPPEVDLALPPGLPLDSPLPFAVPGRKYLEKRGFSLKVAKRFNLSYCYDRWHPFFQRLIIPIYNSDGTKIVGYQGRDVTGEKDPKYLFPLTFQPGDKVEDRESTEKGVITGYTGFKVWVNLDSGERQLYKMRDLKNLSTEKERTGAYANYLYNWNEAKNYAWIILVEGVTDCWRVWMTGLPNVVATFGKTLKENQRRLIMDTPKIGMVIFMWDGNALDKAYDTARGIVGHKKVRIVQMPYKMEPDNCPNILERIRNATPFEELDRKDIKWKMLQKK